MFVPSNQSVSNSQRPVTSFDPNLDCIACFKGFLKAYSNGQNKWVSCSNRNNPCVREACTQPYILSTKTSTCFVCNDKIRPVISNI